LSGSDQEIFIDGSVGEGGGQILRSALALSLVTGKPFRMERIRAGRKKPGLQRQHLTAVRAAAEVGRATVEGATLGSRRLRFVPGRVQPGRYHFPVGTAGSTTLVVQTVLPALALAPGPSSLAVEGGTHNKSAPPYEFLAQAFLPLLLRIGLHAEASLVRPGFYPAGGGRFTVEVGPATPGRRLALLHRGPPVRRAVRALVSRLPRHIAEREVRTALDALDWPPECGSVEEVEAHGPGNVVLIEIECEQVGEVFAGFGERGVPAETVAHAAAQEAQEYLQSDVPVGRHLADQLLLPLALVRGGTFRTFPPTEHTRTNLQTLAHFLDVDVSIAPQSAGAVEIRIDPGNPHGGEQPRIEHG
jgi:RNA 3'-terminal phosphate cyclase (ATP)